MLCHTRGVPQQIRKHPRPHGGQPRTCASMCHDLGVSTSPSACCLVLIIIQLLSLSCAALSDGGGIRSPCSANAWVLQASMQMHDSVESKNRAGATKPWLSISMIAPSTPDCSGLGGLPSRGAATAAAWHPSCPPPPPPPPGPTRLVTQSGTCGDCPLHCTMTKTANRLL